jgi:cysteinyl-tRNA synthetase
LINEEAVSLWVHGEHLLFEGKKMSKSSGNVVLLQDVIDRGFDPLAIRLCFLENKYRSQMDLTWNSIEAADETLKRWRMKIGHWETGT